MAILIPSPNVEKESVIFSHIPDDVPTALFTGYTDLRKSIAGLASIIEEYDTSPKSKCLFMFAGRRTSSFKSLLPEGDGFLLINKVFFSKRLHWPRIGGKDNGELWWLKKEQFTQLMSGERLPVEEGEEDEDVPEPEISRMPELLYIHFDHLNLRPKVIHVVSGFTDLRKSITGLSQVVSSFGMDIDDGALFIFCGRKNDRIKLLFNDGDGYILMTKTLFDGSYKWPSQEEEAWEISFSQLYMLLSQHALSRNSVLNIRKRGE